MLVHTLMVMYSFKYQPGIPSIISWVTRLVTFTFFSAEWETKQNRL
jgi:hypothetical protein